jgi:hypothetical protein
MNIKNFYLVYGEPQIGSIKGEVSMKEYNFSNMNFGELTNLREALDQEIKARKEHEFDHLVENVCEAIAELREAFPSARFDIIGVCDICFETTQINVFDGCTGNISSDFFSMY